MVPPIFKFGLANRMRNSLFFEDNFSIKKILHSNNKKFKKGDGDMLDSFVAFHINAVSNFAYMVTSNLWLLLLIVGVVGTISLNLKEEIDVAVREEQNII